MWEQACKKVEAMKIGDSFEYHGIEVVTVVRKSEFEYETSIGSSTETFDNPYSVRGVLSAMSHASQSASK